MGKKSFRILIFLFCILAVTAYATKTVGSSLGPEPALIQPIPADEAKDQDIMIYYPDRVQHVLP